MSNTSNQIPISNRYEVLKSKSGGMGVVFFCLDRETKERVALKTFKPELLSERPARDRFLREATAWVELGTHPHIVQAHRVERVGDGPTVHIVMEWIAGKDKRDASLRAWLNPGVPLAIEHCMSFALHVARGMKYATARIPGFVHRDLKPENILVGADGNARVTDFGLLKVIDVSPISRSQTERTLSNARQSQLSIGPLGTPLYMAPEQWTDQRVDAQTDIYAFGCILFEMLAGEFAVSGTDNEKIRDAHVQGRIKDLPLGVPVAVSEIVHRSLATEKTSRFSDWLEVETALMDAHLSVFATEAPLELPAVEQSRAQQIASAWSYNAVGVSYCDLGKFAIARKYFEWVIQFARRENDRELEGSALGNLGIVCRELGDFEWAVQYQRESLEIAKGTQDRSAVAQALCGLGAAYACSGDTERALECLELALITARELGEKHCEAVVLDNFAVIHTIFLGDAKGATSFYEQSLSIARDLRDRRGEAHSLHGLAAAHCSLGNWQEGIEFGNESLAIARQLGDLSLVSSTLVNVGSAFYQKRELERASETFMEAISVAEEIGDLRDLLVALTSLAIIRATTAHYVEAEELFEKALRLAKEVGDLLSAGNVSLEFASFLYNRGRSRAALEHVEFAEQAYERVGHRAMLQQANQMADMIRAGGS